MFGCNFSSQKVVEQLVLRRRQSVSTSADGKIVVRFSSDGRWAVILRLMSTVHWEFEWLVAARARVV